jgi:UDP-N-acetylglucosamine 1-carboxyvinyltransferase
MKKLLVRLGVKIEVSGENTIFDSSSLTFCEATYEMVKTMRASILVMGPLLAREKRAVVSLPGGCAIGTRPIDIHLSGLEKLGAKVSMHGGYVKVTSDQLIGNKIVLPFPSVGATENLIMAAVFAKGLSAIENVALEPEIDDLINFLNSAGAKIERVSPSTIMIEGVETLSLNEIEHTPIGDRIEAATYLIAGLITNSKLKINGINPKSLEAVIQLLKEMGAIIELNSNSITVLPSSLKPCKVDTAPFPGFPTDVQAQLMALTTIIKGTSLISEHIFENRFMHVPELQRMGANIVLKGNMAVVEGEAKMVGAPVMCTDLRASAALVLAALVSEGETHINRVYHIDRGYEVIDEKLSKIGVNIKRVKGE